VGNPGLPVPFEPSLEDAVLPTKEKIVAAAREMMKPSIEHFGMADCNPQID
jgi:hypothetical protein